MVRKGLWIIMAFLAILIGLYPGIYFIVDRKFGLLNSKSAELLTSPLWNIGFYTHIIFGGIALLTGWVQFNSNFRNRNLALHRRMGKVYVFAVILSSLAGIYIAFFATGGLVPSLGFISLGTVWFSTTLIAFLHIRNGRIKQHQKLMIYSYSLCFAAVTLRIWLPVLTTLFGDFITAYAVVAWLCWIPNLFVARLIANRVGATVIHNTHSFQDVSSKSVNH